MIGRERKEMPKIKTKKVEIPETEALAPVPTVFALQEQRCSEWCFLPGMSHIGPQGLLQCSLLEQHEEEHQIKIEVRSPPSGVFTINWSRGAE